MSPVRRGKREGPTPRFWTHLPATGIVPLLDRVLGARATVPRIGRPVGTRGRKEADGPPQGDSRRSICRPARGARQRGGVARCPGTPPRDERGQGYAVAQEP